MNREPVPVLSCLRGSLLGVRQPVPPGSVLLPPGTLEGNKSSAATVCVPSGATAAACLVDADPVALLGRWPHDSSRFLGWGGGARPVHGPYDLRWGGIDGLMDDPGSGQGPCEEHTAFRKAA